MISPLVREKYGKPLEVEHVFSCEIEPFKQAYIERNFSPPILFRDVCELGNDEATTAYGAKVKVRRSHRSELSSLEAQCFLGSRQRRHSDCRYVLCGLFKSQQQKARDR